MSLLRHNVAARLVRSSLRGSVGETCNVGSDCRALDVLGDFRRAAWRDHVVLDALVGPVEQRDIEDYLKVLSLIAASP